AALVLWQAGCGPHFKPYLVTNVGQNQLKCTLSWRLHTETNIGTPNCPRLSPAGVVSLNQFTLPAS
ncbi:mCG146005, partial [Mus musculus]